MSIHTDTFRKFKKEKKIAIDFNAIKLVACRPFLRNFPTTRGR